MLRSPLGSWHAPPHLWRRDLSRAMVRMALEWRGQAKDSWARSLSRLVVPIDTLMMSEANAACCAMCCASRAPRAMPSPVLRPVQLQSSAAALRQRLGCWVPSTRSRPWSRGNNTRGPRPLPSSASLEAAYCRRQVVLPGEAGGPRTDQRPKNLGGF